MQNEKKVRTKMDSGSVAKALMSLLFRMTGMSSVCFCTYDKRHIFVLHDITPVTA